MNNLQKFLLLVTALFAINNISAQNLSVDDLIKIDKSSVENIETFLISKKFEFAGVEEDALAKMYNYSYSKSEGNYKRAKAHITKYYYNTGKHSISYQILEAEQYKVFKNSLAVKGFKFISKENDGDNLGQTYESSSYRLVIWQGIKNGINWYEISVEIK